MIPASCVQSPSATCTSEWQAPHASTLIRISCDSTRGHSTSSIESGALNSRRRAAFIILAPDDRTTELLVTDFELWLNSAQKELHRTVDPLRQFMRTCQVHSPLPNNCVVERFHEFRQMHDGKRARDFATFLPLRKNLPQQARHDALCSTKLGSAHSIHGTG